MKRLSLLYSVFCILLFACGPTVSQARRVVCTYAGSVIFDEQFDSATVRDNHIIAWHDDHEAVIDPPDGGACVIEPVE